MLSRPAACVLVWVLRCNIECSDNKTIKHSKNVYITTHFMTCAKQLNTSSKYKTHHHDETRKNQYN